MSAALQAVPAAGAPALWMYHEESEQSVLGALLLDNSAYDRVADVLRAEDFYVGGHRLIYRAIAALLDAGHAADAVTVDERLSAAESASRYEQAGGFGFLTLLASSTPSSANIRRYAEVVRERSMLRALWAAGTRIHDMVSAPGERNVQQVLDAAQAAVLAVGEGRRGSEFVGLDQVLRDTMAMIDDRHQKYQAGESRLVSGTPTGFQPLDEALSGLHGGQLVIVAARPAMGKSAFALNVIEHGARTTGKTALVFSLEMGLNELGLRLVAGAAQVNVRRLVEGRVYEQEWTRLTTAVGTLQNTPIAFAELSDLTINDLRAMARRAYREHGGLSLIMIDYLQLMEGAAGDEMNRANEIAKISRGLKKLAKELNVPIIALSQLNRELERRQNKRPLMSDLRESGAIEQDADVILFLYRDEVYNPNTPDKGLCEVIIGKQRNGPTDTVVLAFRADQTRFHTVGAGGPHGEGD